jgi:DNA-binding MarR family transcriptional regulator
VNEPSARDDALTQAALGLVRVFQHVPRQVPPSPARDLTLGQIRLLLLLRTHGPQAMGRLAELFDLRSTAATGFVSRIERYGLVERHHRTDDRRVVECALTEAGERFLDELSGVRIDGLRSALARLEPDELSEFRRLVTLIGSRQAGPA